MGKVGRKHNEKKPEFVTAYAVLDNTICSAVLRKTKRGFKAVDGSCDNVAFKYRTFFNEDEVSLSKIKAVQNELHLAIRKNAGLQMELKKFNSYITDLKKLLKVVTEEV